MSKNYNKPFKKRAHFLMKFSVLKEQGNSHLCSSLSPQSINILNK
jgi:hypothetical protein